MNNLSAPKGIHPKKPHLRMASAVYILFIFFAFLLIPDLAGAEGWDVSLSENPSCPTMLIAISKENQRLHILEHKSPLSVAQSFTCTTGEAVGDKREEGDLRTPEGVYFTERRKDRGLDYDLYGELAYTLNFPNPVDRLNGKTGSGIWIHGRGHEIVPRETKGCVAVTQADMERMEPRLGFNIPVIIARNVDWNKPVQDKNAPKELEDLIQAWAKAWSDRSDEFFEFYDADKYTRAMGQNFEAFKAHKKNLFRSLPWIEVSIHDLRILPGPDYWVTWFGQHYRTPSMVSEGVKRLYWQRDESGRLRIVGREWFNKDLGLEDQYLAESNQDVLDFVESWRGAWQSGEVAAYLEYYGDEARQSSRLGKEAIRDQKAELWKTNAPVDITLENIQVRRESNGLTVRFTQRYSDSSGYGDVGIKTLRLAPQGDTYRIIREDWSAM